MQKEDQIIKERVKLIIKERVKLMLYNITLKTPIEIENGLKVTIHELNLHQIMRLKDVALICKQMLIKRSGTGLTIICTWK